MRIASLNGLHTRACLVIVTHAAPLDVLFVDF